jgi:phenylacetic acid degradation operon negative regulatory protein
MMAGPSPPLPNVTPRGRTLTLGTPSARSLLLTILGEWVLPTGGVWTSALLAAMGAVGVEAKTARQAVARSAEAGLLTGERVGRRTRWRLTAEARELLEEGTDRIYGFSTSVPDWDGRWLVVLTSVPESSRHLRYRVRTRLGWAGFGQLRPGCWVSPWVDHQHEAAHVLRELGLAATSISFVAELGALGDARTVAAEAWSLDEVGADYQAFIATHQDADPPTAEAAFREVTLLVHDWRNFPNADPVLPDALLPPGWRGREAAAVFHHTHRRWAPVAHRWWDTHNPPDSRHLLDG